MKQLLVLATAALLATGCALSPQQIEVAPKPEVEAANLGHNRSVEVIAVDSRGQKAFGSRGGVYKDTALVQPSNDVRAALADSVRKGLQSLEYLSLQRVVFLDQFFDVQQVEFRHIGSHFC